MTSWYMYVPIMLFLYITIMLFLYVPIMLFLYVIISVLKNVVPLNIFAETINE